MGNALSNFGAGALSGYRDVLGMKMKEDALAKRDEAQANRQANLEKLRAEREKPYKDAALELQGAQVYGNLQHGKDSLQLQREQMQQQAADRAAARSDANSARSEQARHNKEMEKLSNPEAKYEAEQRILEKEAQKIKDPAEQAAFLGSGLTLKEFRTKGTDPEIKVAVIKSMESTAKAIDDAVASGESLPEIGLKYGVEGKTPAEIRSKMIRQAGTETAANLYSTFHPQKKEAVDTASMPFTKEQQVSAAQALNSYNPATATPEQTAAYNTMKSRLDKQPKEERFKILQMADSYSKASDNPYDMNESPLEWSRAERQKEESNKQTLSKRQAQESENLRLSKKYGY